MHERALLPMVHERALSAIVHERAPPELDEREEMRIRTARDLGALISDARTARGWSQAELAQQCGASLRWVKAVEGNRPGAEMGMVLNALSVLDIELNAEPASRGAASELDAYIEELGGGTE